MTIAAFLLLLGPAYAERLAPKTLESFDGSQWSGLALGGMTDSDIKKKYQTEKNAIRPEALRIATEQESGVRVDALLDGRGGKAVMRAIRVEYDNPPSLDQVSDALGEKPVALYGQERHEDWRIMAFIKRGVLAMEVEGKADTFVLCAPSRVSAAIQDLTEDQTRVTQPRDPGEGWDRILRFSDSDASVSLGSSKPDFMDSSWRGRLERRLENEGDSIRKSSLRYGSSYRGTLSIRVTSDKFDKDGDANFTVSLSINAETPYGSLNQSASESKKFGSSYERRIMDLFDEAAYDLDRNVRTAIQKLGPPPREQLRKFAMERIYSGACKKPTD